MKVRLRIELVHAAETPAGPDGTAVSSWNVCLCLGPKSLGVRMHESMHALVDV